MISCTAGFVYVLRCYMYDLAVSVVAARTHIPDTIASPKPTCSQSSDNSSCGCSIMTGDYKQSYELLGSGTR